MPWCPKCKTEYRKDFATCSDCQVDLVEQLEEEPKEKEDEVFDHEIFLASVSNNIEADVLESLLQSSGIPVLRKYREAGSYMSIYMGNTNAGVDIYVPSKLYEVAKCLMDQDSEIIGGEEAEVVEEDQELVLEDKKIQQKRVVRAWIILLLFIPGLLFLVLGVLKLLWSTVF